MSRPMVLVVCIAFLAVFALGFGIVALVIPRPESRQPSQTVPDQKAVDEPSSLQLQVISAKVRDQFFYQHVTRGLDVGRLDAISVRVSIANVTETKKVTLLCWGHASCAKLTDEFGNNYLQIIPQDMIHTPLQINPGQVRENTVHFEIPVPKAKTLTLRLPRERYGERGEHVLVFAAPASE